MYNKKSTQKFTLVMFLVRLCLRANSDSVVCMSTDKNAAADKHTERWAVPGNSCLGPTPLIALEAGYR